LRTFVKLAFSATVALAPCAAAETVTGHTPFDPHANEARTEACLATYISLSEATVDLEPKSAMDAMQAEGGRGMARLRPFSEDVARAVGERKFYRNAATSRLTEHRILLFPIPNVMRSWLAHRLAADAADCDHQLDLWRAPKQCLTASGWHVC